MSIRKPHECEIQRQNYAKSSKRPNLCRSFAYYFCLWYSGLLCYQCRFTLQRMLFRGTKQLGSRYKTVGIAVQKSRFRNFWLQAKGLALGSKRPCGCKQKGLRLHAKSVGLSERLCLGVDVCAAHPGAQQSWHIALAPRIELFAG